MMMSVGLFLPGYCLICSCFDFSWQKAFGGQLCRVGGIVEAWRFSEHGDFAEIPDGFFGIVKTCSELSKKHSFSDSGLTYYQC